MKKLLLSTIILFFVGVVFGNTNPKVVLKKAKNIKDPILMRQEIDGPIQLYSKVIDVYETVVIGANNVRQVKTGVIKEYYIGTNSAGEVEMILPANFKKVAKKYFADTPELGKRIGKRGFRYENLPFMILYHNKLVDKGKTLTAADVRDWDLLN